MKDCSWVIRAAAITPKAVIAKAKSNCRARISRIRTIVSGTPTSGARQIRMTP